MVTWLMQFRMLRRRLLGPGAIYFAFVCLALITLGNPQARLTVFRSYLFVLPMLISLLAPGLFLDEPALEVIMTAPRRPAGWVLQRLLMLWLLAIGSTLALWGLILWTGPSIPYPPGWVTLVPSFALSAVALLMGLVGTETMIGLATAGLVWFGQLISLSALLALPSSSYFMLFLGLFTKQLWMQQLAMAAIAAVCLLLSAWLMGREYRYL